MLRTLFVCTFLLLAARVDAQCTTPPTNLAAYRVGADISVTWDDAMPATCNARFALEASRDGADITELQTADDFATIPNLAIGGKWRVAIRAFTTSGLSAQRSVYLEERTSCLSVPPPVVQSVSSSVDGNRVTIAWVTENWCTQTGFQIAAAASPDGPELYRARVVCPSCRTFTAIAPPGVWYVRVYAEYYPLYVAPSPWAVVVVP